MMHAPLPFRLHRAGRDTMGLEGFASVSYRVDGVLHLTPEGLTFDWRETSTREEVSLARVGTDVDVYDLEPLDLPTQRLAGAWVIGGWWWPRLELRVRSVGDLEGVPGARGVTLVLRIHRRDRDLARGIAGTIMARIRNETPAQSPSAARPG